VNALRTGPVKSANAQDEMSLKKDFFSNFSRYSGYILLFVNRSFYRLLSGQIFCCCENCIGFRASKNIITGYMQQLPLRISENTVTTFYWLDVLIHHPLTSYFFQTAKIIQVTSFLTELFKK